MKMLATIFVVLLLVTAPAAFAQQVVRFTDAESARAEYRAELERHIPSFIRARLLVEQLRQVTTQSWSGTDWENTAQTRYSYDGAQQTEVLSLAWQEDDWVNSSRSTTTFDGGLLVEQQYDQWVDDAWEPWFRTLNSYDGGELTESIFQDWVDGEWVNTDRTRMTSSSGSMIEWEDDEWDGSSWVVSGRTTMEESGEDVVLTLQEWVESEWVNTDRTVYADFTMEELFELFTELAEELDHFVGYGFTFQIPDYLQQEWDGSDWLDVARQQTDLDAQVRPILITTENWEDGAWVGSARQARTYEDDRLSQTELQSMEGSEWMTYLVESYTYGDNDRVATVLHQFDFGTGLMNSTLITLEWTSTTVASEEESLPDGFVLEPVYPNPFNPTANVTYQLDAPAHVTVSVYDALGRRVATLADGVHTAGRHQVSFDATDRPSGLYIVRLEGPSQLQSRAVSLIR